MAWVGDELALLVSYRLMPYFWGWGIADERRTETVDRVWQGIIPTVTGDTMVPRNSRENLASLLVPQTAAATRRALCVSVCLSFPVVLSLTL